MENITGKEVHNDMNFSNNCIVFIYIKPDTLGQLNVFN